MGLLVIVYWTWMIALGGAAMPEIVAHRGASFDAPENTLAAFKLAWERGADAVEGDFNLTKDGHIVCIHDKDTSRVARKKLVVADATLAELRMLDVGSWKGEQWSGEKIPTLAEVLGTVPAGKRLLIEVKCGPEILPALEKILIETKTKCDRVVIISFDAEVVARAKKRLPKVKALWLSSFRKEGGDWKPSISAVLKRLKSIDADGLDCNAHECVDAGFADALRRAGLELHVWTVNDVGRARRFQMLGVESLTTDRPGWLRHRLSRSE